MAGESAIHKLLDFIIALNNDPGNQGVGGWFHSDADACIKANQLEQYASILKSQNMKDLEAALSAESPIPNAKPPGRNNVVCNVVPDIPTPGHPRK